MAPRRPAADLEEPLLAAIDVGTNAVRLEVARVLPDGSLETVHEERDPVRPGEGVFKTGVLSREVADRLLSTLRRYGALCRRYHAVVRAVATSAIREAKNGPEIVARARKEAGIDLEVVSGKEEARLICLGVLAGKPKAARSLIIDIGGGSTEIASALGEKATNLWSVSMGAVRLTELFGSDGKVGNKRLRLMREYAFESFGERVPRRIPNMTRHAIGSSGTIQAVVGYAPPRSSASVTTRAVSKTVEEIADMAPEERRRAFDAKRAEVIVAGAVILEAIMEHLRLESITAVNRGLRNGLLLDLQRRTHPSDSTDTSLREAARALGQRFQFDERHGLHVADIALALFDQLAALHKLPAAGRPLLEVAAVLHDIGNAVNYDRHHKHTWYLINNADLPGVSNHERALVALVARFHRRSPPERDHALFDDVPAGEFLLVRKLSTLLRLADALDRSHHQPVRALRAGVRGGAVHLALKARGPVDLELWDAEKDAALFRQVFGKRLELAVTR